MIFCFTGQVNDSILAVYTRLQTSNTCCITPLSNTHLYSRYLRFDFRVRDDVDVVWWNIYCNGGKNGGDVSLKKKKGRGGGLLYTSLNLLHGLFSFTCSVCLLGGGMFADGFDTEGLICIIHGTEQLMVLAPLIYYGEKLPFWMLPPEKKLFTGLYINKIDCAPYLLHFPFFCSVISVLFRFHKKK